jgi:hypothetical protein
MKMEPGVSREIPGEGDEIIHATRIGEIEVSQFLTFSVMTRTFSERGRSTKSRF